MLGSRLFFIFRFVPLWVILFVGVALGGGASGGVSGGVSGGEPGGGFRKNTSDTSGGNHRRLLQVIVVDQAGNPVSGAKVRIKQRRHAFTFGLTLPEGGGAFEFPDNWQTLPLWRCVNSVNLNYLGRWDYIEPFLGNQKFQATDRWLDFAREHGLDVQWGSVFSARTDRQVDWVTSLGRRDLEAALGLHVRSLLNRVGRQVSGFDLYTDVLDGHFIENRLSTVMLRRLFEQAGAIQAAGGAGGTGGFAIGMEDVTAPGRIPKVIQQVAALKQAFVPLDALALGIRLRSPVTRPRLSKALSWLSSLDCPLWIRSLTTDASTPKQVASDMSLAMELLFESSMVQGIWLDFSESGLIDSTGTVTVAGQQIDHLFRKVWWSDFTAQTDERGNVQTRAFTGLYDISAILPDGQIVWTSLYLSADPRRRLVVVGPLAVSLEPLSD